VTSKQWNRQEVPGAGLLLGTSSRVALASENEQMKIKPIPSSGELLPVVGLGAYNVFDVESTPGEIETRKQIVERLMTSGGSLLDTSPMGKPRAPDKFRTPQIHRLLPMAKDLGVAVLINRLFREYLINAKYPPNSPRCSDAIRRLAYPRTALYRNIALYCLTGR
jgi:hypothetical protein